MFVYHCDNITHSTQLGMYTTVSLLHIIRNWHEWLHARNSCGWSCSCHKVSSELYHLLCMLWFVIIVTGTINDSQLMVLNMFCKLMGICKGNSLVCSAVNCQYRALLDGIAELAHVVWHPFIHILHHTQPLWHFDTKQHTIHCGANVCQTATLTSSVRVQPSGPVVTVASLTWIVFSFFSLSKMSFPNLGVMPVMC